MRTEWGTSDETRHDGGAYVPCDSKMSPEGSRKGSYVSLALNHGLIFVGTTGGEFEKRVQGTYVHTIRQKGVWVLAHAACVCIGCWFDLIGSHVPHPLRVFFSVVDCVPSGGPPFPLFYFV